MEAYHEASNLKPPDCEAPVADDCDSGQQFLAHVLSPPVVGLVPEKWSGRRDDQPTDCSKASIIPSCVHDCPYCGQ